MGGADLLTLTCDVCATVIGPRAGRWSCAQCDWDVCVACRGEGSGLTVSQEVAADVALLAREARERSRARARARASEERAADDRARRDAREVARSARASVAAGAGGAGSGRKTARKRVREDGEDGRPPRVKMTSAAAGSRDAV